MITRILWMITKIETITMIENVNHNHENGVTWMTT